MKADSTYDPGSVLLGRYRIVSLVGEGGMGEVYQADDLTLGQPVALKFLPVELVEREDLQRRFQHEVRVARQVTHRNVARVHDIAEVDGRPMLSMEFVDGEDLAQLLRKIGRLPREKALDIARQICAGLSAAHDAGVLHRDLKPANVLIDRAGKVHLTDFGLAGLAEDETEGGVVGTPAYMAPEQITGGPVDARSEVYSLGLLLYELFTGKRAFDGRSFEELTTQHLQSTPLTPTSLLTDMDPAVERVILKCLEKDPDERPSSVKAVAWALPGGDPLAAALAAGETPPPELVATAGEMEVSRGAAVGWLAAVLVGLTAMLLLVDGTRLVSLARPSHPPEVLAQSAREVLELCGVRPPPADRSSGFSTDQNLLAWIERNDERVDRWERMAEEGRQPILFWYRESPLPLAPYNPGRVSASFNDPPHVRPGMARVSLDADARLRAFSLVPPAYDEREGPFDEPDWSSFFEAAGLDPADFEAVPARWTPRVNADRRFAWEARAAQGDAGEDASPLRVEASSFRGQPNTFTVVHPWVEPPPSAPPSDVPGLQILSMVVILTVLLGAGFLARRNYRLGRGDMKGALRLGMIVMVLRVLGWVLGGHHLPPAQEYVAFLYTVAFGLLGGTFVWMFYLALEPYFRRLWPRRLVSWVRLLSGRVRDPRVGRDVLVGLVLGLVGLLMIDGAFALSGWLGTPPHRPQVTAQPLEEVAGLAGGRMRSSILVLGAVAALTNGLVLSVILLVLRMALRRDLLAGLGFVVLLGGFAALQDGPLAESLTIGTLSGALTLLVLVRYGLLAMVVGAFTTVLLSGLPLTVDGSQWFVISTGLAVATVLALAAFGFFTALGGQALFRDTVFENAGATG